MKTIIYLVSEDWYFCSHRIPIARQSKADGFHVIVICRVRDFGDVIRSEGFELVPIEFSRGGFNPFSEANILITLCQIYIRHSPDIVHHVALKPVIYGSIAARFVGSVKTVNAMAGLGFVFISAKRKAKIIRLLVHRLFSFLFNNKDTRLILQNQDDIDYFVKHKLINRSKISLIRGSGVDTDEFRSVHESHHISLTIMLASRMLWDKGVGEFVEAANILRQDGPFVRFVLVGDNDPENPASIATEQLNRWHQSGVVEWWGHKNSMNKILSMACIVCLPSYREGLPKILLEAASSSKPIIATDVPGCRDVVRDGKNGFLVPVRDPHSLADAIKILINNPEMRNRMGTYGRRLVEREFSEQIVVDKTMLLYHQLMA